MVFKYFFTKNVYISQKSHLSLQTKSTVYFSAANQSCLSAGIGFLKKSDPCLSVLSASYIPVAISKILKTTKFPFEFLNFKHEIRANFRIKFKKIIYDYSIGYCQQSSGVSLAVCLKCASLIGRLYQTQQLRPHKKMSRIRRISNQYRTDSSIPPSYSSKIISLSSRK